MVVNGRNRHELEAITRAVLAADGVAEAAMRNYRWARRGLLGRLVRTPIAAAGLPGAAAADPRGDPLRDQTSEPLREAS